MTQRTDAGSTFAVSWLVKGRVDTSIVDTARAIGSKVKGRS